MRPVAVAGYGKTAFGAFPDRDLRSLALEACARCLQDARVEPAQVDAFYLGNFAGPSFTGQNHLAPYIAAEAGLSGVPATRFEAACASSGSAFYHAVNAVAAGVHEAILVCGVEKMTSRDTASVTEILASAGDTAGEIRAGSTFPSLFAMIARRHMHQFGTTREHLAAVAVKNHENGALNPEAHLRKRITIEQALAGKPVADPLTLFDCSLISDGAAAVLVTSADRARDLGVKAVRVRAVAQASDYVALDRKDDITTFPAVRAAANHAYRAAGMESGHIDFAELHDCFTIAEIIASEDLGFAARGEGGRWAAAGCSSREGAKPVNPSGGLKSKGHPVGATGVAQICELTAQIRGEAGERQLRRHAVGLAENLGGSGASCVVSILGAM
ncbi:MAG: thiolase domain-containing protein [Bryobacterales bacterium]|nr:thiolase domain-containing protein [Bryobacterales bacterium]